ncbi:DinB family protein (plasmid) [Bacillus mycoides]|nr:DinB family protein [Bacillus mycoides]
MNLKKYFMTSFLSHRDVTINLAGKIAKAHYGYKPTPSSTTAEELVQHFVSSFYRLALVVKKGDPSYFQHPVDFNTEDLESFAVTYTEKTKQIISSLTEDDFERTIDLKNVFGRQFTGKSLLQFALEHEIHHKGQVFVYVRGMGFTDLPLFMKL